MLDENYYKIGGSLEYQHPTYVLRQADSDLYEGLKNGEFCYVLNSRQMGKSSLRVRMTKKLKEQGIKCASIDMTRIGSHVTPCEWYAGVISELLRGFGLSKKVDFSTWWRQRDLLPPLQRLRELIEDVLLTEFSQTLVIFIDEIDSIIKIKFKEDFFAFIRACYNQRVDNPEYQRLTFCLLGVATPSDLIEDKNISTPFNIGRAIELTGFQLHEAMPLASGLLGKTTNPEAVLREVLAWTGGQPFLTQKVCKLILSASELIPVGCEAAWVENLVRSRLIENWETQDEPEHLRTIRDRLLWSQRKEQLLRLYQQIVQTGEIKALEKPEYMELRLSGLVVKQQGKLRVYNRIYGSIFNQNWVENALAEVGLLPEVAKTSAPRLLLRREFNLPSHSEIQALEQLASEALRQFELRQIKALLSAMQTGQLLKAFVRDGCPLQEYPTMKQVLTLQTILDNIRERNWFKTHQGMVYGVCFSPNRQHIATTRDDGTVQIWNLFGQQLVGWKGHQGKVDDVCFSPNGQLLATAGRDGTARLWNLSGQQIDHFDGHQSWVRSVNFSPNGQLIATAGADGTARVWNLLGQQLVQFDGHQGSVGSASFSPDGRRLATAGDDGTARLWSLSGQQLVKFEGHQGQVWHVSFSPDGQKIATAGADATARVWNLLGQQIAQLNGHQDWVRLVSFSPYGQCLATAGYDGTARLWNLLGQQLTQLNGHVGAVLGMSFNPDGQRLATAGVDGTVRLWDLSEKYLAQLNGHQGSVWSVNFSSDGQLIATAGRDGTARLWNIAGQHLAQLDGHQGSVWSVTFSPDGQYIVTTGSDKTARLWNLAGQQLAKLDGHQGWVTRVIFSPDGQGIATVGRDGTARLWNLSGQLISQVTPQQGWVWSVSFSSDGQLIATVGLDAKPPILDLSGRLIIQLKDYQDTVGNVSFSPDGQYLATTGEDGTARLWNLFGQQLAQLDGYQSWVISVSFSPNGQIVATAGEDGSVCLWDLSGRQVSRFESKQGAIYGISFSPNGQCLATAGQDGTVKLWRVEGLDELLARGCDWLKDYFVTHPEPLEKLEVCRNRFKPIEAGRNIARAANEYIVTHPEELEDLEVCQNPISSVEKDSNLAGVSEVEEGALSEAIQKRIASPSCARVVRDRLGSESGFDSTQLRDLLAAEQWQEAAQETTALMLRISSREAEGWLRQEDIENFPCTDLLTIDQLWVKYSDGRFGFSVQNQTWQNIGGTVEADYQIALKLAECNTQPAAPTTAIQQPLVTTVSNEPGEGFLGEFLVHDKLVRIYQGDITNLATDVIVSSDDNYLTMGGGVSQRIRQVGGDEIYWQARNLIPLSLGEVAVTTAGDLQAKKIFHTVVIDFDDREGPSNEVIQRVIHSCMKKANSYRFCSIAFPLVGTGAGGFPVKVAWKILLDQIIRDLSDEKQSIIKVILVIYDKKVIEALKIKDFLKTIEQFGWKSLS
jgi:WD40 repeat protein/O-acetyl-ADP-ribose deacetylase (regulator of RNase III)